MDSLSEKLEKLGVGDTLPATKKPRKPRTSKLSQPQEIIQVVLPAETPATDSAEITLRREFSGDDMAELIGKLLAGPEHVYIAELKITQTK